MRAAYHSQSLIANTLLSMNHYWIGEKKSTPAKAINTPYCIILCARLSLFFNDWTQLSSIIIRWRRKISLEGSLPPKYNADNYFKKNVHCASQDFQIDPRSWESLGRCYKNAVSSWKVSPSLPLGGVELGNKAQCDMFRLTRTPIFLQFQFLSFCDAHFLEVRIVVTARICVAKKAWPTIRNVIESLSFCQKNRYENWNISWI